MQTASNLGGINGGSFFFVGLPESGVAVDLPQIAYWPNVSQPDAGVMQGIVVTLGPEDLAAGNGRQNERAAARACK